MKELGLDVVVDEEWEDQINRKWLEKLKGLKGREESDEWHTLVRYAQQMKVVGLDVEKEVAEHEPQLRRKLHHWADANVLANFAQHAQAMKAFGLDVSQGVNDNRKPLNTLLDDLTRGDRWVLYTSYAADIKSLGVDVSESVENNSKEIRQMLRSSDSAQKWREFTSHAVAMKRLGLLTPKTGQEGKLPMPSLKKFAK